VVKHEGRTKFARVKLPQSLPRFVPLRAGSAGDAMTFVFLEDVVCANVQALFPGTTVPELSGYLRDVVLEAYLSEPNG
jgi:polyphosphate kinase